jgi:hypothetical protein
MVKKGILILVGLIMVSVLVWHYAVPINPFKFNQSTCEFPCWYGITPGETEYSEIYDLLSDIEFVEEVNESSYYDGEVTVFYVSLKNHNMVFITVRDGVVEQLEFNPITIVFPGLRPKSKIYTLSKFLKDYDNIPEYFYVTESKLGTTYVYLLVYPDDNLVVHVYRYQLSDFVSPDSLVDTVVFTSPNSFYTFIDEQKEYYGIEDDTGLVQWNGFGE